MENTKRDFTEEDMLLDGGFYSDIYKDHYGHRPVEMGLKDMAEWMNTHYKIVGNEIVKRDDLQW